SPARVREAAPRPAQSAGAQWVLGPLRGRIGAEQPSGGHTMAEAALAHIFLSHNAKDKPQVEALARQLLDRGLRPWLDKWEIVPGRSWQEALQDAIDQASAVLVCIGAHGLGSVQLPEVEAALDRAFEDPARLVIPVFLPGAQAVELPHFLKHCSPLDLRA